MSFRPGHYPDSVVLSIIEKAILEYVMSKTVSLSVCTIVKNEAKRLPSYLDSVAPYADEVVMVDTGSSDKSAEIINEYKSRYNNIKVFEFFTTRPFHYGRAKNVALSKATMEYSLILDVDERPEKDFFKNLKKFLSEKRPNISSVLRVDEYLPHLIETQVRVLKTGYTHYPDDLSSHIHEQLIGSDSSVPFDGVIIHEQKWDHWIKNSPKIYSQLQNDVLQTQKNKSLIRHVFLGFWGFQYKFKKYFFKKKLWKDGVRGFKYSFLRGWYELLLQFRVGLKRNKADSVPNVDAHHNQDTG